MKQSLLLLFFLFIGHFVSAQKNFQGTVVYKLHSNEGDKADAELKVIFGDRKLKLLFKEKADYDKDVLLVLLDSAASFTLSADHKTFKKKMLTVKALEQTAPQKKTISGYSTTPVRTESNGLSGLLGGMLGASDAVFYVADSLYFTVPEMYKGNMEFVIIQKNKIVLGAELQITNPFSNNDDNDGKKNSVITAEAIAITPSVLSDNEFIIPTDYVDVKDFEQLLPMADSAAIAIDSVITLVDTVAVKPKAKTGNKRSPATPTKGKKKATIKPVARKQE